MSQTTGVSSQSAKKRGRKPITIKTKQTDKKVPKIKASDKPRPVSFKGKGKGKGKDKTTIASTGDISTADIKVRKQYRCRSGTKAKREIRKLQTGKNATKPLLPYAPIEVLVKELVHKYGKGKMRIQRKAILAIKEALEADQIKQFEVSQVLANHANRVTVEPKDLHAANLVRTLHPGKALGPNYIIKEGGPQTVVQSELTKDDNKGEDEEKEEVHSNSKKAHPKTNSSDDNTDGD